MFQVSLLGPLEIIADGMPLLLGPPKQQVVLAMLAMRPGRLVGVDELIDELWPQRPPTSAVANTRGYAANLRRMFDRVEAGRGLLVRRGSGYELRLPSEAVDLIGFVAECQRAAVALAGEDFPEAGELLGRAEERWRGQMLAGLPLGPVLSARAETVREMRLGLVEQRAELCLATGRPGLAVALLRDHLLAHPLRERGHALLMRALCREGDVPGALAAYSAARSVLVEQLGIEPGAELRQLHQAVLNRDPALERPWAVIAPRVPGRPGSGPGKPALPRDEDDQAALPVSWLPRPAVDFTGRAEAVRGLVAAVEGANAGAAVVRVIDGMAGIGKTALAVQVATQLADRYPDAQLFVDLQGHSAGGQVDPATALVTLLRQLGVPAGRIPTEPDHRIALWRSELAARRTVLVLDNAGSSEQLAPLLPAAPGTLVLVTSRRRLLASGDAPPTSLPVLDRNEAIELLARVAGRDRVGAEPEAAAVVVRRCGYLPLAIRLVGARLAHRPGWRVVDLAQRLDRATPVLSELSAEDHTVASAFSLSYEPLHEPVRRMFRLLGLHPGEHFGLDTAAALADVPLSDAETAVAALVNHHLVEEPVAGRFRLHDLVRDYARELATSTDEPSECRSAIGRILDYYLHACLAATRAMETSSMAATLGLDQPLRPDLLSLLRADLEWPDVERETLRALVRLAAENGHPHQAWRLARVAWRFYFVRGYNDDILDTHRYGLEAARQLDDEAAIGTMYNYRAYSHIRSGDCQQAQRDLETAIEVRERIGDRHGANISRSNLAIVYWHLGKLTDSVDLHQRSLHDRRSSGQDVLPALPSVGLSLMFLGRYEEALRIHRQHLFMAHLAGSTFNVALALANIGAVRSRLGQHHLAVRYLRASLRLRERTGNRFGISFALNELGAALCGLRQLDDARRHHQLALTAAEHHGEPYSEAAALNGIGLTLAAQGRSVEAVQFHRDALTLATRISHPYEQGRALVGIAAQMEPHDPIEARRHWERALAIFRRMNVPERLDVERHLTRLATPVRAV
ncbi:AfsR/SARP family transcriptional regulator [Plantactinospora soyae]|uniref:DNA-binding SARP family transcriptional activator/tetratricopeptide (TPR) repeat protein n=1 Tax=Plantactinospora soyae TaxID=1544732 RepID=A0A927QUT5_9ACTN|nr:AfsR/SARP family transcriptional regulator [Plantactinospora soyae]MBE1484935.1 DNA-binding SARP family transcriptional activator/tetratricopeptide (TPR) repeat protein [Plantactinospora soyae]